MEPVLEIVDLKTYFRMSRGVIKAVDGVSFSLSKGETVGIVGESGCGKSVLALSIMRLVPKPAGKIIEGNIIFNGKDILDLSETGMRRIRGKEISMIFQEPMTALNPVIRVGEQIAEVVRLHLGFSRKEAYDRAVEMLGKVGMPSPGLRAGNYPHQMSGGMRQRVMIAMALSCNPKLLLADEPTTALDVTIQAQILDLLRCLKEEISASVIIITHDLGVVAEAAQNVAVMYAGKLVEYCSVEELLSSPLHPYTIGLMASIPTTQCCHAGEKKLRAIQGNVPNLNDLPEGCSFQDRCPEVDRYCRIIQPEFKSVTERHFVRCWKRI
jgi:peptide/nickel transport system ATP-binding protein/oligopeptide transport system ATP-binding protein